MSAVIVRGVLVSHRGPRADLKVPKGVYVVGGVFGAYFALASAMQAAIVAFGLGWTHALVFVAAMLAGMAIFEVVERRRAAQPVAVASDA